MIRRHTVLLFSLYHKFKENNKRYSVGAQAQGRRKNKKHPTDVGCGRYGVSKQG